MGYKVVKFLGEEYQVSESIRDFVKYDILLSQITKKLLDAETTSIKQYSNYKPSEFPSMAEKDSSKYRRLANEIADDLVKELLSKNIYDVTKKDLLSDTALFSSDEEYVSGYDKFILQIKIECSIKYMDCLEAQKAGIANAYVNAASNITGSGVTVFSSSFTSLVAQAIAEKSVLSSQIKQAEREYKSAERKIVANTDNAYERYCKDIMLNEFFPKLTSMLTDFANGIMTAYLTELTLHGKFDFYSMEQYNLRKAEDMLKNLERVPEKAEFLKQVFLICPYCVGIYEKSIELDLIDKDTFEITESFGFGNEIAEKMEAWCKNHISEPDRIKKQVSLLTLHKNVSETEVWRSLYNDRLNQIKKNYRDFAIMLEDEHALSLWITKNIAYKASKIISISPDSIQDKVHKLIIDIVSVQEFNRFVDLDILSIEDIRLKNSSNTKLKEINAEIETKILKCINDYIDEAKRRKVQMDEAYSIFNCTIEKKKQEINAKEQELSELGFFAFSKKRELKNIIENMKRDLQDFRSDNEPKKFE